jgi:hypothetical protein
MPKKKGENEMLSQQDEVRLKEWFGQLHVLVEGLQAQINALRVEVAGLQPQQPAPAPVVKAEKKATKVATEEPTTP